MVASNSSVWAALLLLFWTPDTTASSIRGSRTKQRNLNALILHGKKKQKDLGACEGPCKKDRDCLPGLVCFERETDGDTVPGCDGTDETDTKYCIDPAQLQSPDPSPAPSQTLSNEPSFSPSRPPSSQPTKNPSQSPSTTPSIMPTQLLFSAPISDTPSKQPSSTPSKLPSSRPTEIPSKSPSTPSMTPMQPQSTQPTGNPSKQPSSIPTEVSRNIYAYYGRPPDDAFPLGLCEGDCKDNTECGPGLYCFQRDPNQPIPGCIGGLTENSRTDYCTDTIAQPSATPTYASSAPTESTAPTSAPAIVSIVPSIAPSSNPTPTPGHIFSFPGGPPSDAYPLQQCQGDCLWHEDCDDGMFCFQRDPYEPVPGCMGGETDGSKTDYCTYIAPVVAPVEPPTENNFRIKMYWDDYYWQEEDFDRVWCMQCKNGCQEGEILFLHYCAWDSARFDLVEVNADEVQIRAVGTSLCLERSGDATSLETCDIGNVLQHWKSPEGSFDGEYFEFSQAYDDEDYCATTHHHPKYGEIIEMHTCDVARFDTTSYWTKF